MRRWSVVGLKLGCCLIRYAEIRPGEAINIFIGIIWSCKVDFVHPYIERDETRIIFGQKESTGSFGYSGKFWIEVVVKKNQATCAHRLTCCFSIVPNNRCPLSPVHADKTPRTA